VADEQAGVKGRAIRSRSSLANRIERREPRPGGGHTTAEARTPKRRGGTDDPAFAARILSGAFVAAATVLGERAATRGRNETESGR